MRQVTNSRAKYSFEDAPYFVLLRMHMGKFFSGDGLLLVFEIAIFCLWTPLVLGFGGNIQSYLYRMYIDWVSGFCFLCPDRHFNSYFKHGDLNTLSKHWFRLFLRTYICTGSFLIVQSWKDLNRHLLLIKSLQTIHIFGIFLTTTIAKRIHIYNLDNLLSMYTETWY